VADYGGVFGIRASPGRASGCRSQAASLQAEKILN
jgi:hypothetical protein